MNNIFSFLSTRMSDDQEQFTNLELALNCTGQTKLLIHLYFNKECCLTIFSLSVTVDNAIVQKTKTENARQVPVQTNYKYNYTVPPILVHNNLYTATSTVLVKTSMSNIMMCH